MSLTSDKFNEHGDCVMLGHAYCNMGCCDPDRCVLCGEARDTENL